METRDYNGTGSWSVEAVRKRYLAYAKRLRQKTLLDLTALEVSKGNIRWRYPVLDRVIDGIKAGDPACVELGVEFIEFGGKQPFGRTLHARTARALRQTTLTTAQVQDYVGG